jgi:hypothetical protein
MEIWKVEKEKWYEKYMEGESKIKELEEEIKKLSEIQETALRKAKFFETEFESTNEQNR